MPDPTPPRSGPIFSRCPQTETVHTPHPTGYVAHGEWAEQMVLTHRQLRCPMCMRLEVWELKPGATGVAPAVRDGECSRCLAEIFEGDPIRTDGNGGWLASCCPDGDTTP